MSTASRLRRPVTHVRDLQEQRLDVSGGRRAAGVDRCRGRLRDHDERGLAAPTVLGLALLLLLTTMAAVAGGRLVADRRQAAAGADLAALAGAVALQHQRDACPDAAEVAALNAVELAWCRVEGDEVRVGTQVATELLGRELVVTAEAHAGPVGPGG